MSRWALAVLAWTYWVSSAHGGMICPFSENNSIALVNGEIWVATHFSNPHITRKGYIYRFAPERNRWELHSLPSPVLCLDHADSSVWVGTYGKGIFRYNYADWQNFKCDIPSDNMC